MPDLLAPERVRANRAQAWSDVIAMTEPTVMLTLGTNRAAPENVIMDRVSGAFRRIDGLRNGNTKYPEKLDPRRRLFAFIAPEKIGLNSHVHVAIWHPFLFRCSRESEVAKKIVQTRDGIDFLGPGRDEYVRQSSDIRPRPRMDTIWRELCPGGHYHARRFDPASTERGATYIAKELKWFDEKDIRLSGEFWPEEQRKALPDSPFERSIH